MNEETSAILGMILDKLKSMDNSIQELKMDVAELKLI
jgi:hypothetical protein